MVLNGLPPGDFPISIFDVVLNGTTIRGSIVGTRLDLKESLEFATAGKVKAIVKAEPLENSTISSNACARGGSKGGLSLTITCTALR
jgi:alcohol dehydrogenase, propanol-preferring